MGIPHYNMDQKRSNEINSHFIENIRKVMIHCVLCVINTLGHMEATPWFELLPKPLATSQPRTIDTSPEYNFF